MCQPHSKVKKKIKNYRTRKAEETSTIKKNRCIEKAIWKVLTKRWNETESNALNRVSHWWNKSKLLSEKAVFKALIYILMNVLSNWHQHFFLWRLCSLPLAFNSGFNFSGFWTFSNLESFHHHGIMVCKIPIIMKSHAENVNFRSLFQDCGSGIP